VWGSWLPFSNARYVLLGQFCEFGCNIVEYPLKGAWASPSDMGPGSLRKKVLSQREGSKPVYWVCPLKGDLTNKYFTFASKGFYRHCGGKALVTWVGIRSGNWPVGGGASSAFEVPNISEGKGDNIPSYLPGLVLLGGGSSYKGKKHILRPWAPSRNSLKNGRILFDHTERWNLPRGVKPSESGRENILRQRHCRRNVQGKI